MSNFHVRTVFRALMSLCAIAAMSCGSDGIVGVDRKNQRISANVGQEIAVTLGNVGPGTYADPPQMSSDVLTYLGVEVVPPNTPAGPTQRFRFTATKRGQAIIEFRRTLGEQTLDVVRDTVDVR